MLVLARTTGEGIVIRIPGYEVPIVIRVVQAGDSKYIRLGFEAPVDIDIIREEMCEYEDK